MSDPAAPRFRPGRTLRAGAVFATFLLLFFVIDRFSGGSDGPVGSGAAGRTPTTTSPPETSAPEASETTAAPTTTAPPTTAPPTTAGPTTTTAEPETTPETTRRSTTTTTLRSADGVTVQILNGTGELRVAQDFRPLVEAEGYRVVRTANANGRYEVSTVFYTPDNRSDALSFRARFPAFRAVSAAPGTLSGNVDLHVVIGENYRP